MLLCGTGPLDQHVFRALYGRADPVLVSIARGMTFVGEPWVVVSLAVAAATGLWWIGRGRDGATLLLVTLAGRCVSILLKLAVLRPRPDLLTHLVFVKTSSFPSGHTAAATVFYVSLALILGRGRPHVRGWTIVAVAVAVGVGLSRVMLGVHWPSDVIGGWAFGLFWVLVTLHLAQRFQG